MRTFFCLISFALLACNCDNRSKNSRIKNSAVIPSPITIELSGNEARVIGDSLNFKISADASIPDSAKPLAYLDDSLLGNYPGFPFDIGFSTKGLGTGSHNLRVSLNVNGKLEGKTKAFTLLSDIKPEEWTYEVVQTLPHDSKSYTQGLFYLNGIFYESKGMTGASALRTVQSETGKVLKQIDIDKNVFAEGITWHKNRIYQLTWTSNVGFVYSENLEESGRFYYKGEGWGLTSDSNQLIMSNGSNRLSFHRENDFAEVRAIEAYTDKKMMSSLNELEYIHGKIYANVWRTNDIVVIDPKSGRVEKIIDLSGILQTGDLPDNVDVLNGIAWDPVTDRLWVTGKYWPTLFEIKLIPKKSAS